MVANCTGFRSRDLVGDKAVYPVRGHLIRVGIFTYLHLLSFERKKTLVVGRVVPTRSTSLQPEMSARDIKFRIWKKRVKYEMVRESRNQKEISTPNTKVGKP